jgi:hypothetical protein
MIKECAKLKMKPVCDYPSYCKTDKNALYIGQSGHLAYLPHRNTASYLPAGFAEISDNWNGLCSYTAATNGAYALCNIPVHTHAWRTPAQYNPGFMCGAIYKSVVRCKATEVANSDKAKTGTIVGKSGDKVVVKCNTGFEGGGTAICGTNAKFNTLKCTKIIRCAVTQVRQLSLELSAVQIACMLHR